MELTSGPTENIANGGEKVNLAAQCCRLAAAPPHSASGELGLAQWQPAGQLAVAGAVRGSRGREFEVCPGAGIARSGITSSGSDQALKSAGTRARDYSTEVNGAPGQGQRRRVCQKQKRYAGASCGGQGGRGVQLRARRLGCAGGWQLGWAGLAAMT
ncbi:uncharacterized protein LOC126106139 [Schistocerca cancellata]|uniref:uncharacterized protein LOC126106139 n=1 Tax=Schistocerca cancellata TaxID=274614 RepID=UPI0021194167|nr:uncharacterized protein LOC126106139 [Schistocerca cancellata]